MRTSGATPWVQAHMRSMDSIYNIPTVKRTLAQEAEINRVLGIPPGAS